MILIYNPYFIRKHKIYLNLIEYLSEIIIMKDIICNNCQKENSPDAMFCRFCGNNLIQQKNTQNICCHCGNTIPSEAKFCNICGEKCNIPKSLQFQEMPAENANYYDNSMYNYQQQNYCCGDNVNFGPQNHLQNEIFYNNADRMEYPGNYQNSRPGNSEFNMMIIPAILMIASLISAFIITWQITAILVLIAIILFLHLKKKNDLKSRYGWMQ